MWHFLMWEDFFNLSFMITVGILIMLFGVFVVIFPQFLAYLIGFFFIVIGLNIVVFGAQWKRTSQKTGKGMTFGQYEILRRNK